MLIKKNIPRLSLIIPTRNGANYIHAPIETILSQPYQDVELIVSVNHSEDETFKILEKYDDPRLRIVSPPKLLSMTGHYEWCLKQAKGEWVALLGDDDGVMPYFFNEFEVLLERWKDDSVEAFTFTRAYYFWPGCEDMYGKSVVSFSGYKREIIVNGKSELIKIILGLGEHFDLPQIYTNNIIKKSLINKISAKSSGIFYHELNPDVYSGVSISLSAAKVVRSFYPMFWTGTSPKSIGVHTSKLTDRNSAPDDRANEFYRSAKSENFSVSDLIGLTAWKAIKSSQLFVLSALFKVPYDVPFLKYFGKVLIALGVASSMGKLDKKEALYTGKCTMHIDIARRNNINIILIEPLKWLLKLIGKLNLLKIQLAQKMLNIIPVYQLFPNYLIEDRRGLYDLLDAHWALNELLSKEKPINMGDFE